MARTVILEHRPAHGAAHYDWMIEDVGLSCEHRLLTWRVAGRPDEATDFLAEQIGHHRAAYLDFEGDIGGGRGVVLRLARGEVVRLRASAGRVEAVVAWAGGVQRRYEGFGETDGRWRFRVLPG